MALAERGLEPRALMELGSTTAIKAAAVGGAGPAVLSALAVKSEVAAGQLVVVECPELPLERTIRAVWHATRLLPQPASRLIAIAAPTKKGKLPN